VVTTFAVILLVATTRGHFQMIAPDIVMVTGACHDHAPVMNDIDSARLTVRRAILARFPPGPERESWLAWLQACGRRHVGRAPRRHRKPG
jgi:hypothetical protein